MANISLTLGMIRGGVRVAGISWKRTVFQSRFGIDGRSFPSLSGFWVITKLPPEMQGFPFSGGPSG
jgi:hypothetical protein